MNKIIISEQAKILYQEALVSDLQLGFEPEIEAPYKWDILSRFSKSGFNFVSLAVATDATSLERTIQFIAEIRARIQANPDKYILATSISDIKRAKLENKLALSFLLQGPNPLTKDLNMLDIYYQLGVRSLILAYNIRNPFADGCAEPIDAGLSRLGKQLIQKMNEIGMIIDCAHTGYQSSLQAMELSQQPVIFSHSNVFAIHAHPRNLKDEQIKAVAATGGVIGVNGNGALLGVAQASPQKYVEHIDYIAQLVGPQHIALGTDLVYFPELLEDYMTRLSIFYSDSYRNGVHPTNEAAIQPEQMLEVVQLLLERGYTNTDINGILGANYLRVIEKVWR
jgi:membrane dipeptidase